MHKNELHQISFPPKSFLRSLKIYYLSLSPSKEGTKHHFFSIYFPTFPLTGIWALTSYRTVPNATLLLAPTKPPHRARHQRAHAGEICVHASKLRTMLLLVTASSMSSWMANGEKQLRHVVLGQIADRPPPPRHATATPCPNRTCHCATHQEIQRAGQP
jgi:hypothetical protein